MIKFVCSACGKGQEVEDSDLVHSMADGHGFRPDVEVYSALCPSCGNKHFFSDDQISRTKRRQAKSRV